MGDDEYLFPVKDQSAEPSPAQVPQQDEEPAGIPVIEGEYVSNQIQFDFRIVTPATDKARPDVAPPVRTITRDTVLSKLNSRDIKFLQNIMEIITLAEITQKATGIDLRKVKEFFGTLFMSFVNLKRAEDGFTAQLIRTNRVEQLSYPTFGPYSSGQHAPPMLNPQEKKLFGKIPFIGRWFR